MNICIDIGNTLTKVAVFEANTMIYSSTVSNATDINALIQKYSVKKGIISSVKEDDPALYNEIRSKLEKLIILDSETLVPIINEYKTPKTLGKDRLAAVIGANYLYPDRNILVVDAGSAIKFDFITQNGEYKGGNIAPGLNMRFKALNAFTSRLPLFSSQENFPLLGRDTQEAIVAGVQNSILFESDAYINELNKVYGNLLTLFTGGDAKFFDNKLKNTIFVIPNLVLIGLNRILDFNA
jgi:type III pantothenate kinase